MHAIVVKHTHPRIRCEVAVIMLADACRELVNHILNVVPLAVHVSQVPRPGRVGVVRGIAERAAAAATCGLVHHAHMRPQMVRLPKRSVALRARVVFALLVHRAHMRPQIARPPSRVVALRARVVSALLVHLHLRKFKV